MLRTQVQFTPEQARRLRGIARRQGISVAELVRRSVDRVLLDESRNPAANYERAARLVGAFADRKGAKDLSRRHDDHLREAYE
jgi:hypothetical protein